MQSFVALRAGDVLEAFVFEEEGHLVTVTYRQALSDTDLFYAFARGIGDLVAAHRFDFLLDFREATGALEIMTSARLSQKWAELARGRDVGRRTAIVSHSRDVIEGVEAFRGLYPFRVITAFDDVDRARDWVEGVADGDLGEVQFI